MPSAGVLFTKENAAEMGRRGGKKSGESRRKKKSMRECLKLVEGLELPEPLKEQLREEFPDLSEHDLTYTMLAAIKQVKAAAIDADINAVKLFTQVDETDMGAMMRREDDAMSASLKALAEEMQGGSCEDV